LFTNNLIKIKKYFVFKDCNHFQVSESIWNYLYSIYGGGPQLLIRTNSIPNVDDQISSNNKPAVTFV
jgi:hypothetical protein